MPFDYQLLVLGAGSGGLAAAQRAASHGAKVAIVEQSRPGGACVNYGCIPEKLLDYAAEFRQLSQLATGYGWSPVQRDFDWSQFVQAEAHHIQQLNHLHQQHLQSAGVQVIWGHGRFLDSTRVGVGAQEFTAEKILIAVGARPEKPAIPGIEHTITWHELYHLERQPKTVAVIGGDPIGVKIAGSLNALGTQVTQIVSQERVLPTMDAEQVAVIQEQMRRRGITLLTQCKVERIDAGPDARRLQLLGRTEPLQVETVLMDAHRVPNLDGLNLEATAVQLTPAGAIQVDEFSRTTAPNIFAIGDCTERIPLTPSAIAQGRAFANHEFGNHPRAVQLDWATISLASHPEAAMVGWTEEKARARFGSAITCYRTQFRPLRYAVTGWQEQSFMKVVVNAADAERVLGLHMVGTGAVEIVQMLAVALRLGVTKPDLDATLGIHPSSAEELFSL